MTTKNCTELFLSRKGVDPAKTAILFLKSRDSLTNADHVSFGEFRALVAKGQSLLASRGVGPGDTVVLADTLSPVFFAWVMATLAQGATLMLVEPWMPLANIRHVIELMRPKAFVSGWMGSLWGLRSSAIRAVPHWIRTSELPKASTGEAARARDVDSSQIGIVTFTSGTTGAPKGVVRTHGYLAHHQEILEGLFGFEAYAGPDLCVFANLALSNLASGRGSVIVPADWKASRLALVGELPTGVRPETLSCGPAFLRQFLKHGRADALRSIQVGGALTDCAIFERAFDRWPDARVTHVYGSSEAEPVALIDAREAVRRSRGRGYFQTLCVGTPAEGTRFASDEKGLWVAGGQVCPMYLGSEKDNRENKRRDANGDVWHLMGDRIAADAEGIHWYGGRAQQDVALFELEQRFYAWFGSSAALVHRDPRGRLALVGEGVSARDAEIRAQFPEIEIRVEARIQRDRRHRARIDRAATLKKGAAWLTR